MPASSSTHNSTNKPPILPYVKYLTRPFYLHMCFGVLGVVALNLLLLYIPQVVANIIDTYANFSAENLVQKNTIIMYTLILLGTGLLVFGVRIFWRFLLIIIPTYNIKKDIKNELFTHILSLSTQANRTQSVGEQISLLSREPDQITQAISWGFMTGLDGIFSVIGVYTLLLISYRDIAWVSLLVYPFCTIYMFFIFKKLGSSYYAVQEHIASMSELTREMFQQIGTIKGFNSEQYYINRFLKKGNELINAKLKISIYQGIFFPIAMMMNSIAIVFALYRGVLAIQQGNASPGDLSAVLAYLIHVSFPFMGLGYSLNSIMYGTTSARRIKKVLDTKTTLLKTKELDFFQDSPVDIHLQNVSFSYPADSINPQDDSDLLETKHQTPDYSDVPFALKSITLDIPDGTWLGITGTIGSGKSTLAKLLVRLYDCNEGNILYNERNVKDFNLDQLRESVLLQNQLFHLFSQSVSHNIAFQEEELNDVQQHEVIKYGIFSGLESDIALLPHHWDTEIGESGILLSGGQKQRVSLARSLLKNTPILILDDIFSGFDYKTASFIINNIQALRKHKTTILISHNLSVLSRSQCIIVMDQGKIVEQGTHDALLKNTQGLYAQSWHEYLISQGQELEQ